MNAIAPFAVLLVVATVAAVLLSWHFSRSRGLLEEWARDNGFELVSSEHRIFSRGPFFWTTSKGQTVYRVTVRDRSGNVRTGWVRCGSFFLGLISDKTEVRWDES